MVENMVRMDPEREQASREIARLHNLIETADNIVFGLESELREARAEAADNLANFNATVEGECFMVT